MVASYAPDGRKGGRTASSFEYSGHPPPPTSSFAIGRAGGTVIVTIQAPIDFDDWAGIDAVLWDLINDQGNLDVVLDLSGVIHLERDAAFLIVHAARQAHGHGGRLRLADRACRDRWPGWSQ
ncbi:MAG: STAS domain-containing protein [Actinomycetota bacterium]|nr:STAS domain-containing protein [Actinomycetota bacterium]